ncbi:MAG TPA: sulfatase-like hydrolase/transferase, partial [Myxococcota bacterium]
MTRAAPAVWRWAFAASLAAVAAADAIVLDLVRAYFGSGYNGFAIAGAGQIGAFFAGGALLDAALLGVAWCGVLAGARLVRARPLRAVTAAALSSAALLIGVDLAVYRLHRVLGDILELGVLLDLAAGSWRNALGQAAQDLPPLALLGALVAAGIALAFAGVARLERWSPRLAATPLPRLRGLAASSAVFAVLGAGALAWSAHSAPALAFGWSEKPAGRVIRALADTATDFDRDGYGEFSEPRDPAALDPAIHPYAVEIPGNGVDEDGVGGDLPIGFAVPEPLAVPTPLPRPGGPSVVLIFLESFRGDLVGMRLDGHPVTPNLDRLAASGTATTAYAHLPITWAARGSLMQGRVVPTPDGATLVDDFLARGYEVAWFSGQHDGLAEEDVRLGTERAGTFYDARQDIAARTTRSLQPISLQVSWKTVTERVRSYLAARHSEAPLFLYVNVVDTHFPYWHRELDDIL